MESFKTLCYDRCRIIIVILFSLDILAFTDANDRDNCPDVVKLSSFYAATFNRTCYLFVDREVYWEEARSECWRMGGEMLVIPNSKTMDFIKKELNSRRLGWRNNGVWNGANDLRRTGWEWPTGEKLSDTFSYWASGEPGKIFDFISFENCAVMRRSDGWRWHDYPCDLPLHKYKYVCQFGMMQHRTTDHVAHRQEPSSAQEVKDEFVTIVALAVGGVILLAVMCSVTYLLYRKHEHQKAEAKRTQMVRFQNAGYATIMQDISRNNDNASGNAGSRPVSNHYFDPSEVVRIYDEVNKTTNHGVNSLSTTEGARPLLMSGATNYDETDHGYISHVPSEASTGASLGFTSSTQPKHGESEYVEMSGGSLNSIVEYENGSTCSNVTPSAPRDSCVSNGQVNDGKEQPKPVNEVKPLKQGADGVGQLERHVNEYVAPMACRRESEAKQNNASVSSDSNTGSQEIHIYTNNLDLVDSPKELAEKPKERPLPPIPRANYDYEVPVNSIDEVN